MSEPILRALMQLFALISDIGNVEEISTRERNAVKSFLARHLSNELIEKYLKFFDNYLDLYINREAIRESTGEVNITILKMMRIKGICEGINRELRQRQKIYIIIQLIDFISFGKDITANELDFLLTVALALNIPENEYRNIRTFIMEPVSKVPEKERLLVYGSCQGVRNKKIRHVCIPNLSGDLLFLNIPGAKIFIVRYTGDRNLFMNGQHIFPDQTYLFDIGSTIKGEGLKTVYYTEVFSMFSEARQESKISLSAHDVTYRFADSENGIQGFELHEESGQLIGILGVSGTGKSTLLNLLNGNIRPQSGSICVNGYDINNLREKNELKGIIGYIPQDDLLIEDLTVFENLFYSARLCLSNLPVRKIRKIVGKMLADLDLWDIRDLRVGNPLDKVISGGQRKRINIALELIREPMILFVDEPTSGLSSVDSEIVINLLKEQTYKGKLVLVNIHQPGSDLFKLFDKIIILDKGGYQIYYGNPNAAVVYFKKLSRQANPEEDQCPKCGNINPEQILQIVEAKIVDEHGRLTQDRKVTPEEWWNLFQKNFSRSPDPELVKKKKLPANLYSIPGKLKQMQIFFIRDLLSKIANTEYLLLSFLGAPLLAFLLAYFTRYLKGKTYRFMENENLPAFIFMCVITSLFLGLILSSEEILKDRKILKRESFLNLSWFSYINSKVLMVFAISAIQTISFILVGNSVLGIKGMTLTYWLVLFSTSCAANMIGLNISSALNSVITIYILVPFILIPQLLFSGVLVKYDRLHRGSRSSYEYVPPIGEMMTARWSFEALAVEQFRNNRYERNFFRNDMEESQNTWYAAFLIPQLKKDVQVNYRYRDSNDYRQEITGNFGKIDYYLKQLSGMTGLKIPPGLEASFNPSGFEATAYKTALSCLDSLKERFTANVKRARAENDLISRGLIARIGSPGLIELRSRYENDQLKQVVLERLKVEKLVETSTRIIQTYEPGFMKPLSNYGRAHFYAPYKKLGDMEISTFWFNLAVIWLVSLLLYITLYFKILSRMIAFFGHAAPGRPESDRKGYVIEMPG
jgi:ABC transport system ATP-binding/permease protein